VEWDCRSKADAQKEEAFEDCANQGEVGWNCGLLAKEERDKGGRSIGL
jgi:hypothetical protein